MDNIHHESKRPKSWLMCIRCAVQIAFGIILLLFLLLIADQKFRSSDVFDDYEYTHGIPIRRHSCLLYLYQQVYWLRAANGYWANVVVASAEEPALSLGVKPGSVIVRWGDWTWNPESDFEHGCRAMHHEANRSLHERLTVVWIDDTGSHEAQIGPGGFGVCVNETVMSKDELSGALAWVKR